MKSSGISRVLLGPYVALVYYVLHVFFFVRCLRKASLGASPLGGALHVHVHESLLPTRKVPIKGPAGYMYSKYIEIVLEKRCRQLQVMCESLAPGGPRAPGGPLRPWLTGYYVVRTGQAYL